MSKTEQARHGPTHDFIEGKNLDIRTKKKKPDFMEEADFVALTLQIIPENTLSKRFTDTTFCMVCIMEESSLPKYVLWSGRADTLEEVTLEEALKVTAVQAFAVVTDQVAEGDDRWLHQYHKFARKLDSKSGVYLFERKREELTESDIQGRLRTMRNIGLTEKMKVYDKLTPDYYITEGKNMKDKWLKPWQKPADVADTFQPILFSEDGAEGAYFYPHRGSSIAERGEALDDKVVDNLALLHELRIKAKKEIALEDFPVTINMDDIEEIPFGEVSSHAGPEAAKQICSCGHGYISVRAIDKNRVVVERGCREGDFLTYYETSVDRAPVPREDYSP